MKKTFENSAYEFISHQLGGINMLVLYTNLQRDESCWVKTPSDFKTYILEVALDSVNNLIRDVCKEEDTL